ncbi:MAG: tail fiber domain-containing protein [Bacteroidota bacterium]
MTKILLLLLTAMSAQLITYSQNVGINADGSTPNVNAMLDIKSANKGILIPRTSTTSRMAIPNTKGLFLYDTTVSSFWYNDGAAWQQMSGGSFSSNGTVNYLPKFTGTTAVGNSQLVDNGQYVGIGTTSPKAGLNIIHNGGIIAKGDTLSANNYTLTETGTGAKFIWHPKRGAIRAGFLDATYGFLWDDQYTGNWSAAFGYNEFANGMASFATGSNTSSSGSYSFSCGFNSQAFRTGSIAMGNSAKAEGDYSFAAGNGVVAVGASSVAMGYQSATQGDYSFALGNNCYSGGRSSLAAGFSCQSTGIGAVALGYSNIAAGNFSFSAGSLSHANGDNSVAMGDNTTATGNSAFSMGDFTNAGGDYSFADGINAKANGSSSVAIGVNITATGHNSMIFGSNLFDAGHKGDFMLGDTDPWNAGAVGSGTDDQLICRFNNGYYFITGGNTNRTGMVANHGDNSWSQISDSTKKEKIIPVDGEVLLTKISKFKLCTWNYKGQDPKIFRHYGPMAQDFHKAFGHDVLGTIGNDTLINQSDFLGVSFTAIQALERRTEKIEQQQKQILELQNKNEILAANNEKLQLQWQNMLAVLDAVNKKVELLASAKNNTSMGEQTIAASVNR